MKKEVINIIKIVGINFNEIIIDIKIGIITYNSIELRGDNIIMHSYCKELDIETNWNDLSNYQRTKILKIIKPLLYN